MTVENPDWVDEVPGEVLARFHHSVLRHFERIDVPVPEPSRHFPHKQDEVDTEAERTERTRQWVYSHHDEICQRGMCSWDGSIKYDSVVIRHSDSIPSVNSDGLGGFLNSVSNVVAHHNNANLEKSLESWNTARRSHRSDKEEFSHVCPLTETNISHEAKPQQIAEPETPNLTNGK